jgi:hypothetical protein
MDFIANTIIISILGGIAIFWKLGVFHRTRDTILYIRENGWEEYRKARRRYDEHMRLEKQALPSKGELRSAKKQQIKRDKARRK